MDYRRPTDLHEALAAMAAGPCIPLAGGTDYYPFLGEGPARGPVLDISAIAGLRGITETAAGWRIGAAATWSDVIQHDLPAAFDGLKQAAREVGSVQIQNRATVAGNLCNASPAADGVPPLLTLNAEVELTSTGGVRHLPLGQFITGNRRTERRGDELMTAILVPAKATRGTSAFVKLGARRYLVISIAMVAVRLVLVDDSIGDIAVAVGACSAVAQRLRRLEDDLKGRSVSDVTTDAISDAHVASLSPIDDIRAPGAYRLEAARELVVRAIRQAAETRP